MAGLKEYYGAVFEEITRKIRALCITYESSNNSLLFEWLRDTNNPVGWSRDESGQMRIHMLQGEEFVYLEKDDWVVSEDGMNFKVMKPDEFTDRYRWLAGRWH